MCLCATAVTAMHLRPCHSCHRRVGPAVQQQLEAFVAAAPDDAPRTAAAVPGGIMAALRDEGGSPGVRFSRLCVFTHLLALLPRSRGQEVAAKTLLVRLGETQDVGFLYELYSAMAVHLRHPNPVTSFYLHAFVDVFDVVPDVSKEVLLRVLAERALTSAPTPFGVSLALGHVCSPAVLNMPFVAKSKFGRVCLCLCLCLYSSQGASDSPVERVVGVPASACL